MNACDLSQIKRRRGDRSNQGHGRILIRCGLLAAVIGLMVGCVTEYSGVTQMSSDPEAALDKRVALARQYIGVGDWENAKRNLELAQEVDPNNAGVLRPLRWCIKAPANSR